MERESQEKKVRHASLFSGIGGFEVAAQWMGWENVFSVEIDKFCQKVLTKNFPNTDKHLDIFNFDGTKYRGTVDVISGGFPCQPFSSRGKREGTSDDRHVWPQMLRVIRNVQPSFVVAENVSGLLTIEDGMVFEQVCLDLETEGYEVQTYRIPACAVNAPHRRDRVWIVANTYDHAGRGKQNKEWEKNKGFFSKSERFSSLWNAQYANKQRFKEFNIFTKSIGENFIDRQLNGDIPNWEQFPTQSPICRRDDGLSTRMDKHRAKRIKALGNAIVPQVAYKIFQSLGI
jgi:DNA (cytosine-5)-methyltransferase 1